MDLVGGDQDDLQEFVDDFSEIAPELVQQMQDGASTDDWDKVRIAAHTLKSNARDLGAADLSTLCATLEQACRAGEHGAAPNLIAEITASQTASCAALAQCDLGAL
ncbi:Hpt domain-containing protein [Dinoroseobacter sp. S375]|uniref:Hpt domain-containing protein n=1 Tax=Dinoroseobacter sp. S375 TaxID=3415136 RepID=UPI003C7D8F43